MHLVWPSAEYLPGYIHALQQGWSPDNLRPEAAQEELARIAEDSSRFLTEQVDREAKGPKVITPDGREVPRLPGYSRWMCVIALSSRGISKGTSLAADSRG